MLPLVNTQLHISASSVFLPHRVSYAISWKISNDALFHHWQIIIDTICHLIPFNGCIGAMLMGEPIMM